MTRAEKAGQGMAKAIIEMACLMYKHCDIEDFYKGLDREIQKEKALRMIENEGQRTSKILHKTALQRNDFGCLF